MKLLVRGKADVSAKDRCNETARCACALLQLYASPREPCSAGNTPLRRAIYFNNSEVVAYLESIEVTS